jgi:hypothetical protein
MTMIDVTWHVGKTRGQLSVTVDDTGQLKVTTASGRSRTVTPYDYRTTDNHETEARTDDE